MLFGLVGHLLLKLNLEPALLLIGFVLGLMLEEYLQRSMVLSRGSVCVSFKRPLSAVFLVFAGILLVAMILPSVRRKKDEALEG